MTFRPTLYPQWASSPTNIAEYAAVQKIAGWAINQAPPSSYENYWKQLVYNWARFADIDYILKDDFVRGQSLINATGITGFHPTWEITQPAALSIVADSDGGAMGVAKINRGASGQSVLQARVHPLGATFWDWRFEARLKVPFYGASGGYVQAGVGFANFSTTNISTGAANWFFTFAPSGGGGSATSYNLGSISSTHYHEYAIEKQGSLMRVAIDDVDVLTNLPSAIDPVVVIAGDVGVTVVQTGVNIVVLVDKIAYGVRRTGLL